MGLQIKSIAHQLALENFFSTSIRQEEELYEVDIPLKFKAAVGGRIHGLACWFDVLFNGR